MISSLSHQVCVQWHVKQDWSKQPLRKRDNHHREKIRNHHWTICQDSSSVGNCLDVHCHLQFGLVWLQSRINPVGLIKITQVMLPMLWRWCGWSCLRVAILVMFKCETVLQFLGISVGSVLISTCVFRISSRRPGASKHQTKCPNQVHQSPSFISFIFEKVEPSGDVLPWVPPSHCPTQNGVWQFFWVAISTTSTDSNGDPKHSTYKSPKKSMTSNIF